MITEQKHLLQPCDWQRGNGELVTLGKCCLCGRMLRPYMLNKTGARCRYDGAQYNASGALLWSGGK